MQEQKKYNLADGNIRKHFVTYKQAAELYSMGMNRIQEHVQIKTNKKKHVVMDDIFIYIREHLTEDISLERLENEFYVSRYHIVEDCLTLLPSNSLCFHE